MMSLSYSHWLLIAPRETLTVVTFGHRFDRGLILKSFSGKLKRPESMKSKCGIKLNFKLGFPASESGEVLEINLPTSGKSTNLPLTAHY